MSQAPLYVALIHYPVWDKNGAVVTTAVTNIDVHDIARVAKVYDLRAFYVVTPVPMMRRLVTRIVEHWETGYGADYNPTRKEALALARCTDTLETTICEIERDAGAMPCIVASSARQRGASISFAELRERLATDSRPYVLLLGTGWGLTDEAIGQAELVLEPIHGVSGYNHLSVRTAAAIILDRLRADR
jgi:hypothetical protein